MDGVDDLAAIVANIRAPKTGQAIEQLTAIFILDIDTAARTDHMGTLRMQLIVVGKRMKVILGIEFLQGLRGKCCHDFSQSRHNGFAKQT